MEKIIYPCLWFNNNAAEAAGFYCSVFEQSKILKETPIATTFELNGTKFMSLNGGPTHKVNSAVSYFVYCGNEKEINRLFNVL
ncbi:VOC family protein [Flavobacteriaceae bacterium KMM 6897]|nr:VOC family protein [Flavobacteriaceae bacterium KMM 6897]